MMNEPDVKRWCVWTRNQW